MSDRPLFYVVDGHALAYRQFFGLPLRQFSTSAGEPTNAVYGFTRSIMDIIQKARPHYLAVSFDMGLSGRDQLLAAYKGTRAKMPAELIPQLERINQVVQAFNIPVLALEGYEADDIIGTAARQAEQQGVDTHIITGDHDLLQLLTSHVTAQLPTRGGPDALYDEQRFREEYGVEPRQLIELKGLMGDSSDNIPGVKGIGDKGAKKLIATYGTLENLYAHIGEIGGSLRERLEAGRDIAFLSRALATIQRDVPVALDLSACVAHDFDRAAVEDLFRELEFNTFRRRLHEDQPPAADADRAASAAGGSSAPAAPKEYAPPAAPAIETIIVRDEAALDQLVSALNAAQQIVWDVETTGIDQMACDLVGIALAVDGDTGYYIPVGHKAQEALFTGTAAPGQLPLAVVVAALRGPLTNPAIAKVAHNAAYDMVVLHRYGLDVSPVTFDTMIAEYVRDPMSKFLGLKNFAANVLEPPVDMTEITTLIGSGKGQISMDQVEIERAAPYAAADAAVTWRAYAFLRQQLEPDADLWPLFTGLEMPLVPVITAMEQTGVLLDTAHLAQLSRALETDLERLAREIYDLSGYGEFNINSPKQLNDVLFGKLGLSVAGLRKTTHGYTTNAAALEELRDQYPANPVISHILEYRELSKLKGTYVDALPALINARTGRVHTSYNQTGTATGRLSSSSPNLQNIPIRTEIGREVRRAFIAPPDSLLLSVDYSQIELRVLAHFSEDPTLLAAFYEGQDIHAATAAAVYGIPLAAVTYEQRSFAKRVNFGLIYGMGAYRLARDSDLSVGEAREFIEVYFGRMPRVRAYLENTKAQARQGPISTLFGRRREFPLLQRATASSNQVAVQGEERVAINMPIQGSAADIIKRAMVDLHAALSARGLGAKMILQVHDELVLEVPRAEIRDASALTVSVMENACDLKVPLRANAQAGPNWRDMEPVGP